MHPDLPSRIAGILYAADGTWDETSCPYRNQARILIETLGLHEEWGSDTFRRTQPGCPCSICVPARTPYCNWCGIPHESSCLRK